jgi:DNA mismatch repair protein MutL
MPEPFENNRRKQLEALQTISAVLSSKAEDTGSIPGASGNNVDYMEQGKTHPVDQIKDGQVPYLSNNSSVKLEGLEGNPDGIDKSTSILPVLTAAAGPSPQSVENPISADNFFRKDHIEANSSNNANRNLNEQKSSYESPTPKKSSYESLNEKGISAVSDPVAVKQMNLFDTESSEKEAPFLSKKALEEHRIIGQIFSTYWLVEYKKELYIIDQHAAHEKVLYERTMAAAKAKNFESQQLLPPIVLTLTLREQEVLLKHEQTLKNLGYEFEHFGGNEYSVRAVPADLYGISEKELLLEFIDEMAEDLTQNLSNPTSVLERVASLSCKAAVKANHTFSYEEAAALIKELLTLENPYHCPHGRPVIVSMSQYELERKFKRIL